MQAKFNKETIKCAFFNWMPRGRIWAVDMGETDVEWEASVEVMWRKFVEALLNVEEVE